MILIVGGAYQGKFSFAKELFPETEWIDGRECKEEEIYSCGGIHHFHRYIERMMRADLPLRQLAGKIADENPEIVIISNEIGCGIVPADAFDRKYRETTGKICTELSVYADSVYRVVCGLGVRLKG